MRQKVFSLQRGATAQRVSRLTNQTSAIEHWFDFVQCGLKFRRFVCTAK
jgi:hypothetical protein